MLQMYTKNIITNKLKPDWYEGYIIIHMKYLKEKCVHIHK